MTFAISRTSTGIFVLNKSTNQQGVYGLDGRFVRGVDVMPENEVSFWAWAQTRSVHISNEKLLALWNEAHPERSVGKLSQ